MPTTEETKKQQVLDQLVWDDSIDANKIQVEVTDNTARLKGTVSSYSEKVWAENDAYSIPGILSVENLLNVEYPPAVTVPSDADIENNIRTKLSFDNRIDSSLIVVTVENGVVTLTGSVPSVWQRIKAEDIAQFTTGVLGVNNQLDVSLSKSFVDLDIENDIRDALNRNSIVDADSLTVSVSDGIVTLSGSQPTYAAKLTAKDIAYYTTGVIDVVDNVTVVI